MRHSVVVCVMRGLETDGKIASVSASESTLKLVRKRCEFAKEPLEYSCNLNMLQVQKVSRNYMLDIPGVLSG